MSKLTVFKVAALVFTGWIAFKSAGLPSEEAAPHRATLPADEQNGWLFI